MNNNYSLSCMKQLAIEEIRQLLDRPSKNYEIKIKPEELKIDGWKKAVVNSFLVLDGSGTLVKIKERVFILTARHTATIPFSRIPLSERKLPVSKDGKVYQVKIKTKGVNPPKNSKLRERCGNDISSNLVDYAILEFENLEEEKEIKQRYGGIELSTQEVEEGLFVFQLGYPHTWPENMHNSRRINRGEQIETEKEYNLILSGGEITKLVCSCKIHANTRSGRGNSGGGLFTIKDDGTPIIIGICAREEDTDSNSGDPFDLRENITVFFPLSSSEFHF
ncbi:MAG: hypothetical protein WAQ98_08310 [Blastocatellia bacterium]